jgi:hypothetical protein
MVATAIREAFALYRRRAGAFIATTLLIFLPLSVALLALQLAVPDTTDNVQSIAILEAVGSILLCAPIATIMLVRSAISLEQSDAASPIREVGPAFGMLVEYVLTQVMVLVVIAALPGALIALGYASNSPTLMTIGAGVLLGSALFNGVRLTVATVAVATGDARYGAALRRSAGLTRGNWLRTFGVIFIVAVIALMIAVVLSSISMTLPEGVPRTVAGSLLGLLANALTVPLVALASYRLYRLLEAQASTRRAA